MPQSGQRGRPSKDAARYKDEVLSRPHTAGWKQQELVSWLADTKDLTIDPRTLRRYLRQWDNPWSARHYGQYRAVA